MKDYFMKCIVDPCSPDTLDWNIENEDNLEERKVSTFEETYENLEYVNPNFRYLSFDQVERLEDCLKRPFEIESARYPTIKVSPAYIITKLVESITTNLPDIHISSIRIMGGFSSYVMHSRFPYNDLDILINLD
eukprot:UN24478